MSVRATQQGHVQRAGQHQVRHVRAPARDEPRILLPQEPPADQALTHGEDYGRTKPSKCGNVSGACDRIPTTVEALVRRITMRRRTFLKGFAATATAALAGPLIVTDRTIAQTRTIYVNTWGGSWTAAEEAAFFKPFTEQTGIRVRTVAPVSYAKLKAQVQSGNYEWDITAITQADLLRAEREGLVEPVDWTVVKKDKLFPNAVYANGLAYCALGTNLAYRKDKFPQGGPKSWADFWDVKKFPGSRSMLNNAVRTVQFALVADGVPVDKVFPLDVDRAFRKLDQIKPHIKVWWTQGNQSQQLLRDGEAELSGAALHPQSAVRGARRNATAWLLIAPSCLALVLLFVVPIAYVLLLSVTDPRLSLAHYQRIFTVPVYTRVMVNTFVISVIVTALCLVIGYPFAYVMARRAGWVSTLLLTVVAMSFWTGFLVRTYAWLVILGSKGPVAAAYGALGLGKAPQLLSSTFSSTLGMTHILLPYMILALYALMRKIDASHLKAAASLGARPAAAFREVFLPLSLPGVVNGSLLVFVTCLGFFVTPVLLGTPRDMMISQLINQQIEELLAFGFASAVAVVLLIATCAVLAIYNHYAGLDRLWG